MTDLFGKRAPHVPTRFYIWSTRRHLWHASNHNSFTGYLRFAHKFTDEESAAIVAEGNDDVRFSVPTEDKRTASRRPAI